MRNIYFSLCLIFSFYNSLGQTVLDTDGLNNLNNVFLYSLKEYCKSLDSTKSKIVYVRKDHFIGDSWPKKIMNFDIKYLETRNDYISVIKQNNGNATIVGITSFDYRKGQFSCGVIPFSATYLHKKINFSNGGGLTVYFTYDSERQGLIFKNEKWWGN